MPGGWIFEPRRESRYPLASFCSRNDAASIVRNRLLMAVRWIPRVAGHTRVIRTVPQLRSRGRLSSRHGLLLVSPSTVSPRHAIGGGVGAAEGWNGRTSLHHNLRRRAVDILLETCTSMPISTASISMSGSLGGRGGGVIPAHDILGDRLGGALRSNRGRVRSVVVVGASRSTRGSQAA